MVKAMGSLLLLLSYFLVSCAPATDKTASKVNALNGLVGQNSNKAIYGDDNRKDFYEITNPVLQEISKSTVALIVSNNLVDLGTGESLVRGRSLKERENLCSGQKYEDEKVVSFCSGSLIAEDLVLTAGHCVSSQNVCDEIKLAFGFRKNSEGDKLDRISNENIYHCDQLITGVSDEVAGDYAIIKLDRKVRNHAPLSFRVQGAVDVGSELAIIGYPDGLSLKFADGAQVLKQKGAYFSTNLDSFSGNSGSPVINIATGQIEGVLSHGEIDYIAKVVNDEIESRIAEDEISRLIRLVQGDSALPLGGETLAFDSNITQLLLAPEKLSDKDLLNLNQLDDTEIKQHLSKLSTVLTEKHFKNLLSKEQASRKFSELDIKTCNQAKVCDEGECRGEMVSKSTLIVEPLIELAHSGGSIPESIKSLLERD